MVMSVYMTISMTVERYLSVVHPLYTLRNRSTSETKLILQPSKLYRSKLNTLTLVLPGVVFSLLFTSPNYFTVSTSTVSPTPVHLDNHTEIDDIDIDGHIEKVKMTENWP